jgi:2-iminoacetate synthase ThiH
MIEENVVAAAGVRHRLSVDEIRRIISDAGYDPRQRNMAYELIDRGETISGVSGLGRQADQTDAGTR